MIHERLRLCGIVLLCLIAYGLECQLSQVNAISEAFLDSSIQGNVKRTILKVGSQTDTACRVWLRDIWCGIVRRSVEF